MGLAADRTRRERHVRIWADADNGASLPGSLGPWTRRGGSCMLTPSELEQDSRTLNPAIDHSPAPRQS